MVTSTTFLDLMTPLPKSAKVFNFSNIILFKTCNAIKFNDRLNATNSQNELNENID